MPERPKWLAELEALAEALENGDPLSESLHDESDMPGRNTDRDSESCLERLWRTVREGEPNYG